MHIQAVLLGLSALTGCRSFTPGAAELYMTPSPADLGEVQAFSKADQSVTITVANVGTIDAEVDTIETGGERADLVELAAMPILPFVLEPGQKVDLQVIPVLDLSSPLG